MNEDELAHINSEMRFLTLELMKISTKRRVPFKAILNEFIQNVYLFERAIKKKTLKRSRKRAKQLSRSVQGKLPPL